MKLKLKRKVEKCSAGSLLAGFQDFGIVLQVIESVIDRIKLHLEHFICVPHLSHLRLQFALLQLKPVLLGHSLRSAVGGIASILENTASTFELRALVL